MRLTLISLALALVCAPSQDQKVPPTLAATGPALLAAIDRGALAWRLSEPDEVRAVIGAPARENTHRDGGLEVLDWVYSDTFTVFFTRQFGRNLPFVLDSAHDGDRRLGLAEGARLVLRTAADLGKLPPFTGLQNVDVSKLDLRGEEPRLRALPFDTGTVWPPRDRLPVSFDPAQLMRDGANPGLGVRALHKQGIDGRGVTIGIIDQPLVKDHVETAGRLNIVAELDVPDTPPQMHGPAVSSLAAGKTVGVAPGAKIAYVSMAMWKGPKSNDLFIQSLERLLQLNHDARTPADRIRVVSISSGMFSTAEKAAEWKQLLERAESEGVLVIHCELPFNRFDFGTLKPLPGGDREKPEGYKKGVYGKGLLVPGDERTKAHIHSATDYQFEWEGGMSWAAPYLAGVAALGFQVNPSLTPARVRTYLLRTATKMPYGDVVNPPAFVTMCKEDPDGRIPTCSRP